MHTDFYIDPHEFAKAVLSTQRLHYSDNEAGRAKVISEAYIHYINALKKAQAHNEQLSDS